jgi:hypothetical protein
MDRSIRPVVEKWGEEFPHTLGPDEIVTLLRKVAMRANSDWQNSIAINVLTDVPGFGCSCGPVAVLFIDDGTKFLDALSGGSEEILKPTPPPSDSTADLTLAERAAGQTIIELTQAEMEVLDEMSKLVPAWRDSVDSYGSLVFFVDYSDRSAPPQGDQVALRAMAKYLRLRARSKQRCHQPSLAAST